MKNQIWKPFVGVLLLVALLLGAFYFPRLTIGDTRLRRVNILSEIQCVDSEGRPLAELIQDSIEGIIEQKFDSVATVVEAPVYQDVVPEGMIAIEDFSVSDAHEMDKFYAALSDASNRPVRIAYFGDSYIEGDILTADLREFFQSEYGGYGVGFVDIDALTSGFRTTVLARAKGWVEHRVNDETGRHFDVNLQGINGGYYIPTGDASLVLTGQSRTYGEHLKSFDRATVFFTPGPGMKLSAAKNDEEMQNIFTQGGEPVIAEEVHTITDMRVDSIFGEDSTLISCDTIYTSREVVVQVAHQEQGSVISRSIAGGMSKFHMSVSTGGASRFYGVALDGDKGVAVDNFSMRAKNGWYLEKIPGSTLDAFAKLRPYDLIIIHFGLNVANEKQVDYSAYTKRMGEAINHIRQSFPDASILVVGIADRDQRAADGSMKTMRGVTQLNAYQRKMAADLQVAYWNLYEAMGGSGSLAKMVDKGEANKDYTHINFKGGKVLAKLLFDVLQNGKTNYDGHHGK